MPTTYKLISKVTVGSGGAANIEFTSIPGTYTDLILKLSARCTTAGDVYEDVGIYFNGSTSSLSWRWLYQLTTTVGSTSGSTRYMGLVTAGGATASTFGNTEFYIPNYTSGNNKSLSIDSVTENNGTTILNALSAGLWSNTAAITSITLNPETGNFVQYSTARLYGIKSS